MGTARVVLPEQSVAGGGGMDGDWRPSVRPRHPREEDFSPARPQPRRQTPSQDMEVSLQRRYPKTFRVASTVLHAAGAVHFTFGCFYDWFMVNIPKEVSPIFTAFGYKLKFLTYWDAILQATYFIICVINDILGPENKETKEPTKFCKVKDYIECAIAFPIAIFVGFTFWGLMAVDRELVLPAVLDPYFPAWLNHVMHTNIVVFQILEMVLSSREYPPRTWGILGLSIFQGTYLIWMHIVFFVSGLWVYPIFNVLALPARIAFMIASFCTGYVFYFLGEYLNKFLWGRDSTEVESKRKKEK